MFPFWQSFLFIVVAEMGDKTQLVALAFASRFRPLVVLAGIFAATLLVHLASVAIGEVLGLVIPRFWIAIAAGIAFIFFGLWTLRGDSLEEGEVTAARRFGPFLTVGVAFFLAELGDKSMLATITLATQHQSFVPVWLGSTLGMVAADALAIGVGAWAGRSLPNKMIRYGAAAIFLATGVFTVGRAFL